MTNGHARTIAAHLDNADIAAATSEALAWVKAEPSNSEARRLLIDVLILGEDFERADKQADILAKTSTEFALGLGLLRGRLRAANARRAWFVEGAVPAFPEGPTRRDQLAMQLAVAQRNGDAAGAATALEGLTAASETGPLKINGKTVHDFRDADDRVPHAIEVLCTDGSYMWVDHALIELVEFTPAKSLRDLAWRPAKLTLKTSSESEVVICATYFAEDASNAHRLARETDWSEMTGGAVSGKGQKTYIAGDDVLYALELATVAEA